MTKTKLLLLALCSVGISCSSYAQENGTKKDSIAKKQDNFMDLASKSLTGILGKNLEGDSNGITEGIGFLELLEQTGFTEKEKEEYRKIYFAQSKDLTKAQKDSLDTVFYKRILEEQQNKKQEK